MFMYENNISIYENERFATWIIFSPQKLSRKIGLYIISCMEFSSKKIWGQNFHAWK